MKKRGLNINKSRNKKAWIRILESVIAVMILAGFLLIISAQDKDKPQISNYVYETEKGILESISLNEDLRKKVLNSDNPGNMVDLQKYVRNSLPSNLEFELKICDLDVNEPCSMGRVIQKDVFVSERIISADLETYKPKKVKLFVWAMD